MRADGSVDEPIPSAHRHPDRRRLPVEPLSMRTWDAFAVWPSGTTVYGAATVTHLHRHRDPDEERRRSAIASSTASRRGGRRRARWYSTAISRSPGTSSGRSQGYRTSTARSGAGRRPDAGLPDRVPVRGQRIPARGDRRGRRRGALALIAAAGGGLVEAYPHDLPEGKKTSASFLTTPPGPCTSGSGSATSAPRARATA